ncbi:hypothetical protein [Streptomyces sp. NPDC091649]|uniref:hypothetical protein n=1 Tax=Streptomyces sp. NPDC091649 TaxID=3366004 RepID=UPI0037F3966C
MTHAVSTLNATEIRSDPTLSSETDPASRGLILACLVIGILFSLRAAWLLLVTMPDARDDERAFTAPAACTIPGRGDSDCLRTVSR